MPCTKAYREHIMYTFNGYCKTIIRFAAITAWRDRSRRRQKEISQVILPGVSLTPGLRLNCLSQNKLVKMKWHGNTYIDISNIHSIHIFKTV